MLGRGGLRSDPGRCDASMRAARPVSNAGMSDPAGSACGGEAGASPPAPVGRRIQVPEAGGADAVREDGLREPLVIHPASGPPAVPGFQPPARAAQGRDGEQRELQRPLLGRGHFPWPVSLRMEVCDRSPLENGRSPGTGRHDAPGGPGWRPGDCTYDALRSQPSGPRRVTPARAPARRRGLRARLRQRRPHPPPRPDPAKS
jgi:hypothetical protein